MELFTTGAGLEVLMRWLHVFAGVIWIGVLYYFNFIQTPFFGTEARWPRQGPDDSRPRPERPLVVPLGSNVHVPFRLDHRRLPRHEPRHSADRRLHDQDPDRRPDGHVHVVPTSGS